MSATEKEASNYYIMNIKQKRNMVKKKEPYPKI